MDQKWMYDQELSQIDPEKLKQLSALADQGKGLGQKELLPFLMAAASKSNQQHINFSSNEVQMILAVLKKNKSSEDQEKLDRFFHLIQQMQKRH